MSQKQHVFPYWKNTENVGQWNRWETMVFWTIPAHKQTSPSSTEFNCFKTAFASILSISLPGLENNKNISVMWIPALSLNLPLYFSPSAVLVSGLSLSVLHPPEGWFLHHTLIWVLIRRKLNKWSLAQVAQVENRIRPHVNILTHNFSG